ncbi:MAG: hypothetical protein R3B54_10355 [Bdellovibrionota bacterium]
MSQCKICKRQTAKFILNNKPACMRCDVLLFDLEIELEEERQQTAAKNFRTGKTKHTEVPKFN